MLETLDLANELYSRGLHISHDWLILILVKSTSDATLDSHLLVLSADLGATRAQCASSNLRHFDVHQFINRLSSFSTSPPLDTSDHQESSEMPTFSRESTIDWLAIGQLAQKHSKMAPTLEFLYDSFSIRFKRAVY